MQKQKCEDEEQEAAAEEEKPDKPTMAQKAQSKNG